MADKQKSFSPVTTAASGASISALAGVSVLLVAHQWAVVMQDLHGMFPVPTGATEIFEADLGRRRGRNMHVKIGIYAGSTGFTH